MRHLCGIVDATRERFSHGLLRLCSAEGRRGWAQGYPARENGQGAGRSPSTALRARLGKVDAAERVFARVAGELAVGEVGIPLAASLTKGFVARLSHRAAATVSQQGCAAQHVTVQPQHAGVTTHSYYDNREALLCNSFVLT